jgi:hypothetical protein
MITMSRIQMDAEEHLQNFLDTVSSLQLTNRQHEWYQIDVSTLLGQSRIQWFETKPSGESIVFLKNSLVLCCPKQAIIRHFPKQLVHCFVEDSRGILDENSSSLFRIELFSISPIEEQLHWTIQTSNHTDIPELQSKAAGWLHWLNS